MKLGQNIKKHPLLFLMTTEVLVIAVLLILMFMRGKTEYIFEAGGEITGNMISGLHADSGSYEVLLSYRTDSENATYQVYDSFYLDNAMQGDLIGNLDPTHSALSVPFWMYHGTDDLYIKWTDDVRMDRVVLRSTNAMYAERLFYFVIFLILADLILYRFLRSRDGAADEIRTNRIWGIIGVTTLVASVPLMINYLLDSRGDISFHLARIEGIFLGLKEGRFPVRMNGFMLHNQGYADPIFYPNLFLYIPALFRMIGMPILRAYKLFAGLWNLFTCILAYYSFRTILRRERPALTAMVLFVLSPYRNLCLNGRGALGEALAMTFFPLVAAGLWILLGKFKEQRFPDLAKGMILLSLGLSGILQSHILSCEMVGVVMILALLICAKRTFRPKTFLSLLASAVLVVLLNLWFLIPFLQSYGMDLYVFHNFDLYIYENTLTLYHFFGVPLDMYGQSSILSSDLRDEMAMTLGFAILLGLFMMAFGIRLWAKKRKTETGKMIAVSLLLGGVTSWMTTYLFPWKQVESIKTIGKLLCMVQFPWRYLGIATFCFVLAIAGHLSLQEEETSKEDGIRSRVYPIAMAMLAIILSVVHFHSFVDQTEYYAPYSETGLNTGRTMIQAEYLYTDTTIEGLRTAAKVDHGYRRNNCTIYFDLYEDNAEAMEVATPLTYYPYYVAEDIESGNRLHVAKGEMGTAVIYVPEHYSGTVRFYIPEMKRWIIGDLVSLCSLVGLIAFGIVSAARKRKTE